MPPAAAELGRAAVESALALINGKEVEKTVPVPVVVVTRNRL